MNSTRIDAKMTIKGMTPGANSISSALIHKLPDDVLWLLFRSLSLTSLVQVAATSKRWNHLVKRHPTYRDFIEVNRALNEQWTHIRQWIDHAPSDDLKKFRRIYKFSDKIYGPLMRTWVEKLLQKAHSENRQLVFIGDLAIAPYQMALKLLNQDAHRQKYPGLTKENQILLGHFNEEVIKEMLALEEKGVFQACAQKKLNIKIEEKCLFVAISDFEITLATLIKLLPETDIELAYAISHTPQVSGFIRGVSDPIQTRQICFGCIQEYLEKYFAENAKCSSTHAKIKERFHPSAKIEDSEPSKLNKRSYFQFDTRIKGPCYEDRLFSKFFQLLVVRNYSKNPLDFQHLEAMRIRFDRTLSKIFRQVKFEKPAKEKACALS